MNTLMWVSALIIVLLVLAVGLVSLRRRSQLQQRFGPEYDRAVERQGNRLKAEQHLAAVAQRHDSLTIRELKPSERRRWTGEWSLVQSQFVDSPTEAVNAADGLISTVLRERGYPVEHFEERAALLSVDHPEAVEHYRAARELTERQYRSGTGDTEYLRQALVHYRVLFQILVPEVDDSQGPRGRHRLTDPPRAATPPPPPPPLDAGGGADVPPGGTRWAGRTGASDPEAPDDAEADDQPWPIDPRHAV